jgi:hypothetical protein
MIRDDWLMRQVNGFAAGLAQLLAGETVAVGSRGARHRSGTRY